VRTTRGRLTAFQLPHSALLLALAMAMAMAIAGGCSSRSNPAFVGVSGPPGGDAGDGGADGIGELPARDLPPEALPADLPTAADVLEPEALPADADPPVPEPIVEPVTEPGPVTEPSPDAGTPPDVAEVGPDLPPGAVPVDRVVSVTGAFITKNPGENGGTRHEDTCPGSTVLVGYDARVKDLFGDGQTFLVGLRAICGDAIVRAGNTAVTTFGFTPQALRGTTNATTASRNCAPDQVVVGAALHLGTMSVENIEWRCAPFTVAASPAGALTRGSIVTLPISGDGPDRTPSIVDCPAGQVARGHVFRVGSFADAYHLICGTPSVAP
jgi:hypothetical protein